MGLFATLTTIQTPTNSLYRLTEKLASWGGTLVVAGDKKGPATYNLDSCNVESHFLNLHTQVNSQFGLARILPTGHYCRKNIAYLHAIAQGATCIYETDDDNAPLPAWQPRTEYLYNARIIPAPSTPTKKQKELTTKNQNRWINVYKYFTDALIWPRGFPLDVIHGKVPAVNQYGGEVSKNPACLPTVGDSAATKGEQKTKHEPSTKDQARSTFRPLRSPIQQGLVNNSPDVDAIWRLTMDRPFSFEDRPSLYLSPGNWCPFNTQSTWWWPVAYPLLYVPSYCSFRMCDIWKSFVAQRCLWELGCGVAFHAPEVVQRRNIHDLMADFRNEIPGYNRNRELAALLEGTELRKSEQHVGSNLRRCYEKLVGAGFFPEKELDLIDSWLLEFEK